MRLAEVAAATDKAERRITRRVGLGLALASALVAATVLAGLWTPRVAFAGGASMESDAATRTATLTLQVANQGLVPARIGPPIAVAIDGVEAAADGIVMIAPLSSGEVTIRLKATDCSRILARDAPGPGGGTDFREDPITFTAHTWHGDEPINLTAGPGSLDQIARQMCGA